jgi:outer membrane protein OmpA-like peptidoglycan-associated protein
MKKSNVSTRCLMAVFITVTLAFSACATKKYVRQQVAPVNQKLAYVQKETNEKIAATWSKLQSDMSEVNERISSTDQRVSQVSEATQQAQGTASRAMEETQTNATAISANTTAINTLASGVANSINYKFVESSDVFFGFDKASLTPQAKSTLDQVASKVQSLPRAVVELAGFTSQVGSAGYNLGLSRRRAEAVQRYLISQKVPLRNIHMVGMGQEAPPPGLEKDLSSISPNPSKAELNRLARRVRISIYGAGDITDGTASRSQE